MRVESNDIVKKTVKTNYKGQVSGFVYSVECLGPNNNWPGGEVYISSLKRRFPGVLDDSQDDKIVFMPSPDDPYPRHLSVQSGEIGKSLFAISLSQLKELITAFEEA